MRHWLSTPLRATDYREPLLIQVYFGGLLSDQEFIHLLEHEVHLMEERLAAYHSIYKMYQDMIQTQPDPRTFFLSITTLEYGILSNKVAVDWLKSLIERVRPGDYTLKDLQ